MSSEARIGVVTGAGSHIGRACALALLAHGWTIVLAGRRADALAQTAEMAGRAAGRAHPVPADISDPDSVAALFAGVRAQFGRLDLLFNNAGAAVPREAVPDAALADWRTILDTTVTGTFLCAQHAFRIMRDQTPQGGRILNNGAPSAWSPRPGAVAFTTAKHAVLGLTRAIALDGRPYRISCGQIDIGNVEPPDGALQPPARQGDGSFAAEPVMSVQRVADAVLMMASMPLDASVQYLTVLPTAMPFIGRG
jgi:NAD(P)-dependent dehydrogenase (short-subunit alcohol dehydrogenase family)